MPRFEYEYPPETITVESSEPQIYDGLWDDGRFGVSAVGRPTVRHEMDPQRSLAEEWRIVLENEGTDDQRLRFFLVRDTPLPDEIRPVPCPVCEGEPDPSVASGPPSCAIKHMVYGPGWIYAGLPEDLRCKNGWMSAAAARYWMYVMAGLAPPEVRKPWTP